MSPRRVTVEEIEGHVARFPCMRGATNAFMDQQMPGQEREIINVIGFESMERSVIEQKTDPATQPIIPFPAHGFNVQYARAKPGGGGALHLHRTEEVFVPLTGRWSVFWLEGDEEREVVLEPFDCINIPTDIFRGFRNVGDVEGVLLAVIGGPDSGKVDWHDSVLARARSLGLVPDAPPPEGRA